MRADRLHVRFSDLEVSREETLQLEQKLQNEIDRSGRELGAEKEKAQILQNELASSHLATEREQMKSESLNDDLRKMMDTHLRLQAEKRDAEADLESMKTTLETEKASMKTTLEAERASLETTLAWERDLMKTTLVQERELMERSIAEVREMEQVAKTTAIQLELENMRKTFVDEVKSFTWESFGLAAEQCPPEISMAQMADCGSQQVTLCTRTAIGDFFEKMGMAIGSWPIFHDGDMSANDVRLADFLEQRFHALHERIGLDEEKYTQRLRALINKIQQHFTYLSEKKKIQAESSSSALEVFMRMRDYDEQIGAGGVRLELEAANARLQLAKKHIETLREVLVKKNALIEAYRKQLREAVALLDGVAGTVDEMH